MKVVRVKKGVAAIVFLSLALLALGALSFFAGSSGDADGHVEPQRVRDVQHRNKFRPESELKEQLERRPEVAPVKPRTEPEVAHEEIHEQERKLEEKEENEEVDALRAKLHPVEATKAAADPENEKRKEQVVKMMLHAWHGYRNYTWGANEIKPISGQPNNQGIFGGADMGATIVDAADTLWLMGLKEEYEQARDWIRDNFDMKKKATGTLSVFETTIRFLGGLLSLNALTGEAFYVTKAKDVGDSLLKAFNTPTGIPKSQLSVQTGVGQNFGWASSMSILSEIGTLHLEFAELSRITGDPVYLQKVQKVRDVLDKAQKLDGLYPNYISPTDGRFSGSHISLGALGDSFYEYLIKAWLYSNFRDDQARRMYWAVSEKIQEKMVSHSRSNLTYLVELRNGRAEHQMGHLACFAVGMFALEGHYEKEPARKARVLNLAEELGRTCHESYIRSESHIGPEMFYFIGQEDATAKQTGANGYILRPEVIEGWFYLWRLTGKQMYRDWVWDAVESMEKWCKREKGYVGLQNVYKPEQGADDVQQSFFLAETLKYAYLTFTEDTVMALDAWVFNTEAHPLPVNKDYPMKEQAAPQA
ncbi:unnamed protein product, partial [Mesorhabditis spiculigera]